MDPQRTLADDIRDQVVAEEALAASRPSIAVVSSSDGDWHAFYLNGEKQFEGHSLHWGFVLNALNIPFESREVKVDPYDPEASFPETLPSPP